MHLGDHEIIITDRACYFPKSRTLVLADLHVGRAITTGIDFPTNANIDMVCRLSKLLTEFTPQNVVFAGDILHSFSGIPLPVSTAITHLIETVTDTQATLILIKGNHDPLLETVPDLDIVSEYRFTDEPTIVCHGHNPPKQTAERYVIGHNHPALIIEGKRYPCVLYGENAYNESDVVILPSFNTLTRGTPVNMYSPATDDSPFLEQFESFKPILIDTTTREPLVFPPLNQIRDLL